MSANMAFAVPLPIWNALLNEHTPPIRMERNKHKEDYSLLLNHFPDYLSP